MGQLLEIRESRLGGRGVFALIDFQPGEVLHECLVLYVPEDQEEHLIKTSLSRYYYDFNDGYAIALGYGSLFNHSYEPNARWCNDDTTMKFVAVKDIAEGDEILINYNGTLGDMSPLVFEVKS